VSIDRFEPNGQTDWVSDRHNPDDAARVATIRRDVEYTNKRYTGIVDLNEINRARVFGYGNPLSLETYKTIFGPSDIGAKPLDQTLAETAKISTKTRAP
jgi:hypothetical protein